MSEGYFHYPNFALRILPREAFHSGTPTAAKLSEVAI